jgi:hypothetical protein
MAVHQLLSALMNIEHGASKALPEAVNMCCRDSGSGSLSVDAAL